MFYRQRDVFAITVAAFWLGDNLASVAPYAADARWQLLNLVSPVSGNPEHDWNVILGTLGILQHDATIGNLCRWSGLGTMAAALLAGAWTMRVMATTREVPAFVPAEEEERFTRFMAESDRAAEDAPGAEIRRQAGRPPGDG